MLLLGPFVKVIRDVVNKNEWRLLEVMQTNDRNIEHLHLETKDSTGMFPLSEEINLKQVSIDYIVPSLAIYLIVSIASGYLFRLLNVSKELHAVLVVGLSFTFVAVYLVFRNMQNLQKFSLRYYLDYEMGRREIIAFSVSLVSVYLFIYLLYFNTDKISLNLIQIILIFCLFIGNIILLLMPYELASYIFFGLLTFLVNFTSFAILDSLVEASAISKYAWDWTISQTGSAITAITFAFVTNRAYVFSNKGKFWTDFVNFVVSRIFATLVFEYGSMFVCINLFNMDREISKVLGSFLVTVANYFISKLFVFREK